MVEAALPLPLIEGGIDTYPFTELGRDGWVARRGRPEIAQRWAMQATWDGAVAVECAAPRGGRRPSPVEQVLPSAWTAAAAALRTILAIPDPEHVPAHLAIRFPTQGFHLVAPIEANNVSTGDRPVQRWTTLADPSDDEIESVYRELARSVGVPALEPPRA
jgi:hypothetical protein